MKTSELQGYKHALELATDKIAELKEKLSISMSASSLQSAHIERLRKGLEDTKVVVEHWGSYASKYFQDKWHIQDDFDEIDRIINSTPTQSLAIIQADAIEKFILNLREEGVVSYPNIHMIKEYAAQLKGINNDNTTS